MGQNMQFDPNLGFYYLRARYYNPGAGRFQNMDTFAGRMFEPVTLHKYLYANGDPISFVDPTGKFGIAEASIVNNIVGVLTTLQVNNSFAVFDTLGIEDDRIETARTINRAIGLFNLGTAGARILKFLSPRAAARCIGQGLNCIRALLGKVKTPHGIARQENSAAAWTALKNAQNGTPLFRLGQMGTSRTASAQFWSPIDPRSLSPSEFARAFGIPKANANFDFLIVGRLRPGAHAIARSASGVGSNVGGNIELVTEPGSVALDIFQSL